MSSQVHGLLPVGVGISICMVLAAIIYLNPTVEAVVGSLGNLSMDGKVIRDNFLLFSDGHRKLFNLRTLGFLINPVVFFTISLLLLRRMSQRQSCTLTIARAEGVVWIMLLVGFCAIIVYGSGTIHLLAGSLPLFWEQ